MPRVALIPSAIDRLRNIGSFGPTTALHCTACRDGSTHANFDSSMQTNATGWGKRVASRLGLSGWQMAGASGLAAARRTLAREELRGQVGNLRQDVNNIANSFDKTKKKAALASRDAFNKSVCTCAELPPLRRPPLNGTTTWPTDRLCVLTVLAVRRKASASGTRDAIPVHRV